MIVILAALACTILPTLPAENDSGDLWTPPPEPAVDVDGDGYTSKVDCDDLDPRIYPGAEEECDDLDHDCDGDDRNGAGHLWYWDDDGDGYGAGEGVHFCVAPDRWLQWGDDCDDGNSSTYPDARELCDRLDNDCDGLTDDGADFPSWSLLDDPSVLISGCWLDELTDDPELWISE